MAVVVATLSVMIKSMVSFVHTRKTFKQDTCYILSLG